MNLHTNSLIFITIISFFFGCRPAQLNEDSAVTSIEPTTIIIVRHAERASESEKDPELSPEGIERANNLAVQLAEVGISVVYSTPYQRTRSTVSPLAKAQNLEIRTYDPAWGAEAFADTLLSRHPGERILVAGHSNTVPALVNALAGQTLYSDLPHDRYGDVFIISLSRKREGEVVRLYLK